MSRNGYFVCVIFCSLFCACSTPEEETFTSFVITEKSDAAYPDNPDIGFRSTNYDTSYFEQGALRLTDSMQMDFHFHLSNGDTIVLQDLDIKEWIPAVPRHLAGNDYLCQLSLINQEWNRNQVALRKNQFRSGDKSVTRIDLARNCLSAYLWELIVYSTEEGKEMPLAHAWFDFPHALYESLFDRNNPVNFAAHREYLEDWKDPASKKVERSFLCEWVREIAVQAEDLSDENYLRKGERAKKFKEIIYPAQFVSMKDLQTDSALFATFTPPGMYSRADPRVTELGRFYVLDSANAHETRCAGNPTTLHELELVFLDKENARTTKLVLGGFNLRDVPVRTVEDAHKGWQCSMGFGNHTFYENYEQHQQLDASQNPYYAYLCDEENRWLDSHKIGTDGPLLHWDAEQPNVLHLWLLSFERHALVGHYRIAFESEI